MTNQKDMNSAVALLDPCIVRRKVPLTTIGPLQVGGLARFVIEPRNVHELSRCLKMLRGNAMPAIVIGDGANLLFDDFGFDGAIIRMGRNFSYFEAQEDGIVKAGAGNWTPCFVRRVIERGFDGCVHAIGIPGSLGGLIAMNGGSRRESISDRLLSMTVMSMDGEVDCLSRNDIQFSYRSSGFQEAGLILIGATFRFMPGDRSALRSEALEILAERREKFPSNRANCGSVFVSDPQLYERIGSPGIALERAGLKGLRFGDAQISTEHANFIVNCGTASSYDILRLIHFARHEVEKVSGVAMTAEVRHVSPKGDIRPAHIPACELFAEEDEKKARLRKP